MIWLWWVIDLPWFQFESEIFRLSYPIICSCGKSCLLVSWCIGDMCDMADNDGDLGTSRRPGAEDRGWSSTGRVLGGRTIGRSGDAVCGLHRAHRDEECWFLRCDLKARLSGFPVWASKPTTVVCWFGSQNHRDGFLVWTLKPRWWWFVGCTTKSTGGGWRGTQVEI
jgi:hypothetical protein